MNKIKLCWVQKDCLISYADLGWSQSSVPSECVGRAVAVVVLDTEVPKRPDAWGGSMLAAYHEGKQIAVHRISHQKKDMVVNPQHYRRLTVKQSLDVENPLLEQSAQ